MNINISHLPQSASATVGKQPQTQTANAEFKALMGEFAMPENESTTTAAEGIVKLPSEPVTNKDTVESIQHHAQDSLSWQAYYHSGGHFNMPAVLPSYAEAARAIGPGGPYSVEAVSNCILNMAAQVAQGNPDKIAEIRQEIAKAVAIFRRDYQAATKEKDLPQICLDTYDAIMSGLDKLQAEYTEQNAATEKSA
ncbi:hypothetical protein [Selenomonas ruminantium]|uniref:hypothetical protein n=1 Tax=Selenomonas ruminantium TaxID=971 RepID=UPI0026F28984|nr:hypothetical protein [Selenomonas ruminantium]